MQLSSIRAPIPPPIIKAIFFTACSSEGLSATIEVKYPGTTGHRLQTKIQDMISSLQWQTVGVPG
jgi:hypothetical protein